MTEPVSARGRIGSRVATKILVSFLFGTAAFLMTWRLSADPDTVLGLGVSIFVGGVAFVVQFLIDVEGRVHSLHLAVSEMGVRYSDQHALTQALIREEITKVSAATELFGAVEASALRTDVVTQLVRNATSVKRAETPLVFEFAQAEINRLSGYLRDLGQQADVVYDGEDRDWMLGLTRSASESIDATSLTTVDAGGRGSVDGGLWSSDLGQRYLEAQQDAIANGVKIRRIFVLDREPRDLEDFRGVLHAHQAIGVEVRTIDPSTLTRPQQALLVDFIIIDGVLLYQSQATATNDNQRPRIVSTRLVTDPKRVALQDKRYRELWDVATPLVPDPTLAKIPNQTKA